MTRWPGRASARGPGVRHLTTGGVAAPAKMDEELACRLQAEE